jgi:hypothetical protein
MLLRPYVLDDLARARQADFEAEAAHQAKVAEALSSATRNSRFRPRRSNWIVPTPVWPWYGSNRAMQPESSA